MLRQLTTLSFIIPSDSVPPRAADQRRQMGRFSETSVGPQMARFNDAENANPRCTTEIHSLYRRNITCAKYSPALTSQFSMTGRLARNESELAKMTFRKIAVIPKI